MDVRQIISAPTSVVFPPQDLDRKTFCVLGLPRGGTSMVAIILRRLGIFMGQQVDPTSNEDLEFLTHKGHRDLFTNVARAHEKRSYLNHVAGLIAARSKDHRVWGWKDPIASHYIGDIRHLLTGVHFILVTRDVGATSQREMFNEGGRNPPEHILVHMRGAASTYLNLVSVLAEARSPTLLVSYERSMADPERFVNAVAEFTMTEPPSDLASLVSPI